MAGTYGALAGIVGGVGLGLWADRYISTRGHRKALLLTSCGLGALGFGIFSQARSPLTPSLAFSNLLQPSPSFSILLRPSPPFSALRRRCLRHNRPPHRPRASRLLHTTSSPFSHHLLPPHSITGLLHPSRRHPSPAPFLTPALAFSNLRRPSPSFAAPFLQPSPPFSALRLPHFSGVHGGRHLRRC